MVKLFLGEKMKKFRFKLNKISITLLILGGLLSLTCIGWNIFNITEYFRVGLDATLKLISYILVIAVAVAVSVVCVSVIAFSYYIVTDSNLVLALGVIRSKTPLKNVTEVTYFKKQKKLVLYYADNDNSPESYTVIVIDEARRVNELALLNQTEFTERYKSLKEVGEVFSFAENNFMGVEMLTERIKKYRLVAMQALSTAIPFFNPLKIINPQVGGVADYQLDFKEIFTDIKNWLKGGYAITVCTGDLKRAENFCFELSGQGIASVINGGENKGVDIITKKLSRGFIFHEEKSVVIGSGNLFVKPVSARKIKSKKKGFFTAPEVGDFCVHEIHGIGRVLGNKKISTTEGTKDYVAVEYSGGDILYVPIFLQTKN